ncbi:hypothetical protein AB0A67_31145, partial [Streptomyces eurythermus]
MTAGNLINALAVEATVRPLDLAVALPHAPGPSPEGPAAVRAALDGLPGRPGGDPLRAAVLAGPR